MLEQLVELDIEVFLFLNNLGTPAWDGFWMFYTTKYNWFPFYGLLVYFIFKNYNRKEFILIILLAAFLITFTDQITNLFKSGVGRLRPCFNEELDGLMRLVKSKCGGKHSFFSGHASNSMAVALFTGSLLRFKYKFLITLLVIWAVAMAYSRVYIGVHYPLDILTGLLFGGLSGFGFFKLFKYLNKTLLRK